MNSSVPDDLFPVRRIAMNSVTLAENDYVGLSHVVGVDLPEPNVHANLFDGSDYTRLDRFNRVIDNRWTKQYGAGATDIVDFYHIELTYDYNSNITTIRDHVHDQFSAAFTMDDLDRLIDAEHGTWIPGAAGSIRPRSSRAGPSVTPATGSKPSCSATACGCISTVG